MPLLVRTTAEQRRRGRRRPVAVRTAAAQLARQVPQPHREQPLVPVPGRQRVEAAVKRATSEHEKAWMTKKKDQSHSGRASRNATQMHTTTYTKSVRLRCLGTSVLAKLRGTRRMMSVRAQITGHP